MNFFKLHNDLRKLGVSLCPIRKIRLFVSTFDYSGLFPLFDYLRLNFVLDSYTDKCGFSRIDVYEFNSISNLCSLHGLDINDYILEDDIDA